MKAFKLRKSEGDIAHIVLIMIAGFCICSVSSCTSYRSNTQRASSGNGDSSGRTTPEPMGSGGRTNVGFGDMQGARIDPPDELHSPPKGSSERQAIMDALREDFNDRRSPVYQPHRGDIVFVVNYLEVQDDWAWTFAEPRSSNPEDSFGENNGFLLHLENQKWKVMALPPMVDDPDDPENLDYPGSKDIERIRKKYPSVPKDIFPNRAG